MVVMNRMTNISQTKIELRFKYRGRKVEFKIGAVLCRLKDSMKQERMPLIIYGRDDARQLIGGKGKRFSIKFSMQ